LSPGEVENIGYLERWIILVTWRGGEYLLPGKVDNN